MLLILEDLGKTGTVTKGYMLSREQYYLDLIFKDNSILIMNNCSIAGTTCLWQGLNINQSRVAINSRLGSLNPMSGKQYSPEFLYMQTRNKNGINNPNYGGKKSTTRYATGLNN